MSFICHWHLASLDSSTRFTSFGAPSFRFWNSSTTKDSIERNSLLCGCLRLCLSVTSRHSCSSRLGQPLRQDSLKLHGNKQSPFDLLTKTKSRSPSLKPSFGYIPAKRLQSQLLRSALVGRLALSSYQLQCYFRLSFLHGKLFHTPPKNTDLCY